jgi:hypothetical protein
MLTDRHKMAEKKIRPKTWNHKRNRSRNYAIDSKKAAFLMTVSLFMVIALVTGIATYYSFKSWKQRQRISIEPQLDIGNKQLDILLTSLQAEQDLYYLDMSAKYASAESFLRLAEQGGTTEDNDCGEKFVGYTVINDNTKFCDMDENIDEEFGKMMNLVFFNYAMKYSTSIPSVFEYNLISDPPKNTVNILGTGGREMKYALGTDRLAAMYGTTSEKCHYCGTMKALMKEEQCKDFCCEGVCPDEALLNTFPKVPYLHQCGETETTEIEKSCIKDTAGTLCNSGCGPTSANMVAEYFGVPPDFAYYFNMNGENTCYPISGVGISTLIKFLKKKNIDAVYEHAKSWDDLVRATREGVVIMLQSQKYNELSVSGGIPMDLCKSDSLTERSYCAGGHYIVVVYANEDYAIVNDPYSVPGPSNIGNNLALSRNELDMAWYHKNRDMIVVKGRGASSNADLYGGMLIANDNDNFVEYYPLDSTGSGHKIINLVYGKVSCSPNGFSYGASFGASKGDNIYSIAPGKVVRAGRNDYPANDEASLAGIDALYYKYNVLEIDHNNGYYSRYYFSSKILVNKGDTIAAGQNVAEAGLVPETHTPLLYLQILQKGYNNNAGSYGENCIQWNTNNPQEAVDPLTFYVKDNEFTTDLRFSPLAFSQPEINILPYYNYMNNNKAGIP